MPRRRASPRQPVAKGKTHPTDGTPTPAPVEDADAIQPPRRTASRVMVGLGGSAGSIPALQEFFRAMPAESGLIFVVIVHLSPEHESTLPQLLSRCTPMPVLAAKDGARVDANHVYVIPPAKILAVVDGHLRLTALEPERGRRVAVDLFFRSLADIHGPQAAAIVLSGADGDGAIGIKRIKECGGLTIAQDPEEAEHFSMPKSAIATGMVDWVLPVGRMPERLLDYVTNAQRLHLPPEDGPQPAQPPAPGVDAGEAALRELLILLRKLTGRDFSYYKRATIVRRIARRMRITEVQDLPAYLDHMRAQPGEASALLQDLLISVTNFFRDRDAFAALERRIPELFREKGPADIVRVWVPACATGEEAYSMAMLLLEHARTLEAAPGLQVFGCDLDEQAVQTARSGLYPFAISADVSEERLRRFFIKETAGYRVRRELREIVLFSAHDLLRDAPFSRLDLVSCRNLLIYLNREAQHRAFDIFHFAVRPGGMLFLGSSEAVDEESPLFQVLDKQNRLYTQQPASRASLPLPAGSGTLLRAEAAQERAKGGPVLPGRSFGELAGASPGRTIRGLPHLPLEELHFRLLERIAPPSVIVNSDHEVVHLSESAGRFLELIGGSATMSLLRIVRPALRETLRSALRQVAETGEETTTAGVSLELDGEVRMVELRLAPAAELAPGFLIVVFQERKDAAKHAPPAAAPPEPALRQLERDLETLRARLRASGEEYEVNTEELKASNEEFQAMNEELRSASEELETSREELQSLNEELTTVNHELSNNLVELEHTNSDLQNLMAATAIATVFLDRDFRITRFTPSAATLFRVIPGDIGRPLADLRSHLEYPGMAADAARVLKELVPLEREVRDGSGRTYLARLLPYRTIDERIAGIVLSCVEITPVKQAQEAVRASERRYRHLFNSMDEGFVVHELVQDAAGRDDFRYIEHNPAYAKQTGFHPVEGRTLREMIPGLEPVWLANLATVARTGEAMRFQSRVAALDRWFDVFASSTGPAKDRVAILFTDVSQRVRAEEALRETEEQFRRAVEDSPIPVILQAEDGQVLQISRTWTELTGYTREEIPTMDDWLQGAYGPGANLVREHVQSLFRGETARLDVELEVTARHGGRRQWAFSASAPGKLRNGRKYIVGMALDVTERNRAAAELRESRQRLQLIMENARDYAIITLDAARLVTSWNGGAEAILGYSEPETLGQSGDFFFPEEARAAGVPEREAATALAEGRAEYEEWYLRKDGTRFWSSGVVMAMRDDQGRAIGLLKIFRDRTAERRVKEALETRSEELWAALQDADAARDEALAAGRAKDHFLAVLSHELRTPLTPVLMAVGALAKQDDLPPSVGRALEMIKRNIRLEARLIDDLLDLTRISRGGLELLRKPFAVHDCVRHAVEVATPDLVAKDQRFTMDLEATSDTMDGDATRLQQVFWNLLKNASKFTPREGEIRIHSRLQPASGEAPSRLVIEVIDNGVGFAPEAAERIFEAFTQESKETARTFGGLGLGLAIAKATVAAHGGTLRAHSPGSGQGATFTVELPLNPANGA